MESIAQTRSSGPGRLAAALLMTTALCACTEMAPFESVEQEPATTPASPELVTAHDTGHYLTVMEFAGYANPATGELDVWITSEVVPPGARGSDGLATVQQGGAVGFEGTGWCPLLIERDGVAGTNPPNSAELYTLEGTDSNDAATCAAATNELLGIPTELMTNGYTGPFDVFFVLCGDVILRHFYGERTFTNLYAEITDVVGNDTFTGYTNTLISGYGVEGALDVGRRPPTPGTGGLFPIGNFGEPDGLNALMNPPCALPAEFCPSASTYPWLFFFTEETPVTFTGRVVALEQEDCEDTLDNDCDGVVNNGCGDFSSESECFFDIDCATAHCSGESIAADTAGLCCDENQVADTDDGVCFSCPTAMGLVCAGNGDCLAGEEPGCDCYVPSHNLACSATCADAFQNGDETGVDCGGTVCEPCVEETVGCTVEMSALCTFDSGDTSLWYDAGESSPTSGVNFDGGEVSCGITASGPGAASSCTTECADTVHAFFAESTTLTLPGDGVESVALELHQPLFSSCQVTVATATELEMFEVVAECPGGDLFFTDDNFMGELITSVHLEGCALSRIALNGGPLGSALGGDTCALAESAPVDTSEGPVRLAGETTNGLEDDYDGGECASGGGFDKAYRVTVPAGHTLAVYLDSSSYSLWTPTLYIIGGSDPAACGSAECLAGGFGSGLVSYTNLSGGDEPAWVIVDSADYYGFGYYDITFTTYVPGTLTPDCFDAVDGEPCLGGESAVCCGFGYGYYEESLSCAPAAYCGSVAL